VRYSAMKSMILVECGPKRSADSTRNKNWKPASKRILVRRFFVAVQVAGAFLTGVWYGALQDAVTQGIFDTQPEMRCAAAEAAAMAIEDDDPEDLIFDLILTAGKNTMAIDKSKVKKDCEDEGAITRKPSVASVVQELGFGRAPSFGRRTSSSGSQRSTGSQRSSKWAKAFERLQSDPKIERTEAFFSRLGQAVHMEGTGILMKPAHPPASLDAGMMPQNGADAKDLQGKIAIFVLHPRRMHMAMIYDCAYRCEQQGAIGAVFCVKKPEITAADRYDGFEMQKSFDQEESRPAPNCLNIPVICVSELMKNAIEDNVFLSMMPNTSVVRGLLVDDKPVVRAAALRALGAVAQRNDHRLVEVLISMISDPAEEVRRVCVEVFTNPSKIWPGNPFAIEELANVTTHEDWHVREASMTALCKVANCDRETCDPDGQINNPVAIEAVIARLKDTEGLVKKLAIDGLVILALADGVIDAEDLPIIDTFVESQGDADPLVAAACTKALVFLSGEDKDITSVFQWVSDCRPQIRNSSVYTLGKAKQNNPVIILMLRKRTLDEFGEVRACAATTLAKVTRQGDAAVMSMLDPLLDDRTACVRCAAAEALAEVMFPYEQDPHGSLPRLMRLVEMVTDEDIGVRNSASDALEKRAHGSPEVATSLKEVLETHPDFCVRKSALQLIHRIMNRGEERMLDAIRISLRDARGEVRKLGFQLLKHHYEAGRDGGVDVDALKESVLDCVKDGDPMVVFVTIESIPALFSQGNRMAIMALARCLRHEAPSVREAATRVLGQFAIRGDLRAINYIVPLIDHSLAYVRYAAIIALMTLGIPGDLKVLDPIKSKMNDPEIFVRREAVTALQHLSVRGDERCVLALLSCMEDPDERIRMAAMTGLSVIANYAEPRVVAAFMKKIRLDTRPMRKLSVECLACLIKEDDYDNLELLMTSFEDTEHIVRQAGVEAVTKIVRKGDDFVIKRLMETRCQHEDRKIRAVAMQVLQAIALPGDERILDGMILALRHFHAQVRKMAAEVICNVANIGDHRAIGMSPESCAHAGCEKRASV
jgi:HEAT repeat protein